MVVYYDTSTEPVRVFDSGDLPNPETFGEYRLTYCIRDNLRPRSRLPSRATSR